MNEYVKAARIVRSVLLDARHLDDLIDADTSPLAQQICYGVCRNYYFLTAVLDELLDKPLANKHQDLNALLLAALYSVDHLKRPAHASVNAAVSAAAGLKKSWAKGLVNGVLRRYLREREALANKFTNDNHEVQFNHPDWLIDELKAAWPDEWRSIVSANQQQAPMTLRINRRLHARDEYIAQLVSADLIAVAGALSNDAVILNSAVAVTRLPGFAAGSVSVQDEAAQLAAGLLNLETGQRVLDACAAPGGKTCHILELADVDLLAVDRDRKRIGRIEENLKRLSFNAEIRALALEELNEAAEFDRILLDAPCSATGIIRRHPDIKLLRLKSDIAKLAVIQRALLQKAFDLLKPGGELVYATCSVIPTENELLVSAFLESNARASSLPIRLSATSDAIVSTRNGVQLLPTHAGHDGFYYARIGKAS